jgi:Uma2 family endonuclease
MTVATVSSLDRSRLLEQQHLTLDEVSWSFYEQTLDEVGDRPLRVTYFKGRIEIMAPLAEHESGKEIIGALIETFALERDIPLARFGSTTFRRKDRQSGLEPDKCYYFENAARVRGMKRFDPTIHPAPDLAVAVDITARSIAREPIYADLGVPEIWRYDGARIIVLVLNNDGNYAPTAVSKAIPDLPNFGSRYVHPSHGARESDGGTQKLPKVGAWLAVKSKCSRLLTCRLGSRHCSRDTRT